MNNKRYILISIFLWIIISYSMFLAYNEEWKQARNNQKYVLSFENVEGEDSKETESVVLEDGTRVSQTIQIGCEEFTGIALHFESEKVPSDGRVTIELIEKKSGRNVETWSRSVGDIVYGQFSDFILTEQICTDKDSEYIINVLVTGVKSNSMSMPVVEASDDQNVSMLLNSSESEYAIEYRIINGDYNALRFLAVAFYVVMSITIFVVMFMNLKKITPERIFVAFTILIGFMYMFALPPFSVPDEPAHFVQTYMYSSELIQEQALDEEGRILVDDEKLWGAGQTIPTRDSYDRYFRAILGKELNSEKQEISTMASMGMSRCGYFPQIIGVSLGRVANLSPEQLIMLGRLFALMWYVFIMYWAIKIIPFGKITLFTIGTLPMTMQMVVSYNYDSVLFGACFFLVAYLLKLIFRTEKVSIKDIALISVLAMIIAAIKFIYLPILGLALFVPKEKFNSNKQRIISAVWICGLCVTTLLYQKISVIQKLAMPHVTNATNAAEAISLGYIIEHPRAIFNIFVRTIEHQLTYYISGMIASPLGWLEIWLPNVVVIGFIILLLLGVLSEPGKKEKVNGWIRCFCCLIAGIMALLGLMAMLLDCTSVTSSQILGFQGRYWLPILPLVIPVMQNEVLVVKKNIDRYLMLGLSYLHCVSIFYITLTIIGR